MRLFVLPLAIFFLTGADGGSQKSLSRRKRLAVFPEGSTWSFAMCQTSELILKNNKGKYVEAINWGFSYDLPTNISAYDYLLNSKHITARRTRRDLYERMENILESMGLNGRSCVLRSLCEASRKFLTGGSSLFEEILRIIFKFPLQIVHAWEPQEHTEYRHAFANGSDEALSCQEVFSDCPFSLLDMALHGQIKL